MEWELLAPFLNQTVSSLVEDLSEKIGFAIKNKILEYQAEAYNRNYFIKTILHKVDPVKLLDIYYPLQLQRNPDLSRYKFDHLEGFDIKSVIELFQDNQYITIIGDAGSGKSTLIKYLFLSCLKENYKIPITIELRNLNNQKSSLEQYITNRIFNVTQISTSEKISARLLSMGKFLFFFDGYDEINSEKKENLTQEINEFVRKYNKNSYLMTSRPYTGVLYLPLFKNFWISKLSIKEVEGFIEKQMVNKHIKLLKPNIVNSIYSFENEGVFDFLSNPLLLSIFILTYEYNPLIPQKKSLYYQQVFEALFSAHDSLSKFGYIRDRRSNLNKEGFEKILQQFSALTYFRETHSFRKRYLSDLFLKIKSLNPQIHFDNSNLIYDLTTNIGLIVKEGWNHYYFAHRSLQEYFAALYINNLDQENKLKIYEKILQKINDPKSKEMMNFISILEELDKVYFFENMTIPHLKNIKKNLEKTINPFDFFSQYADFNPPIFEIMLEMDNESPFVDYLIHIRTIKQQIQAVEKLSLNPEDNPLNIDNPRESMKASKIVLEELSSNSIQMKKNLIKVIDEKIDRVYQLIKEANLKNSEIVELM